MRSKREALLRRLAAAALSAAVLVPAAALAGPPFRTDDPEPVEYQHWEFYSFTAGTHVDGDTAGVAPAAEFNYGLFPNAMVHIVVPTTAFDHPTGSPSTWGLGDVELGFKYRLLEQDKKSWKPSIGIFPLLELPTGDQSRTLGAGHTRMFLPVWAQKDFGDWTTYGGGGYWINQNDTYGSRNYWFVGWLLQRKITDKLTLGGEIYHQTADLVGGFDTTGFNLGGQLDLDEHNHLLFSAGRGFQNAAQTNLFSWYLGWQVTY